MALSRTNNADATAVSVRSGATRVKRVTCTQRSNTAARLYLQIFNSNTPTVGTTAPDTVIAIPAGRAGMQVIQAAVFGSNLGGLLLPTGCAYAVTTTPTGAAGPSGTDRPRVDLHWTQAA